MKCKYSLEDIINYFEGSFSKDKVDEISTHLKICEKCRTNYGSLVLTKKFAESGGGYRGNILPNIEKSIDKNKYTKNRKLLFVLGRLFYNNRHVMKSATIVLTICIALIFVLLISGGENSKFKRNIGISSSVEGSISTETTVEDSIPTETTVEDSTLSEYYTVKAGGAKSPNGEMHASVIRENGMFVDSILLTDNSKKSYKIVLENIMYTGIESFTWIDNNRLTLCGHVNPSLQVYVIIDANKKEIVGKYDGLGFAWNKDKNKLYYVLSSPHFDGNSISDKIVDIEGTVYYKTEKGKSIIGKLAISENEQRFAFFVRDNATSKEVLVITERDKDNKHKKKSEIDSLFGDIEFQGNNSIKVTDINNSTSNYLVE